LISDISYLEGLDDLRLSEASGADVRTFVGVIIVGEKVSKYPSFRLGVVFGVSISIILFGWTGNCCIENAGQVTNA
tara:strand:- start:939 stop:1166 length:228 start_codon:yes stop_codon:yes gene_type:complete